MIFLTQHTFDDFCLANMRLDTLPGLASCVLVSQAAHVDDIFLASIRSTMDET